MGSLTSKIVSPMFDEKDPHHDDDRNMDNVHLDCDPSDDILETMDCDISLDLDDTPNKYQRRDLDLSSFPFSHPRVFSQMLLSLDSHSLLSLRLVCSTWLRWMNSCLVWSKVLPLRLESARWAVGDHTIRNMRLDRLEELPRNTEEECRQLCIRVDRVAGEEVPPIDQGRIHLAEQLQLAADLDQIDGPVLGPLEVFVRVKVDHPIVKNIVKENIVRYLNAILVDETDQRALMMWRRFPVLCTEGAMLPVEFKQSVQEPPDEKDDQEQASKRIRLDEDMEDEEREEENLATIDKPVRVNPKFPSLLELVDFDDPIIKTTLVQKTGMDKILLCPRFIDIMSEPSSCWDPSLKVQGVGVDGKVCEVDMSVLNEKDVAVMGYYINLCFNPRDQAKNLVFWAGPDIRHNWPEFSQQLNEIDSNIEKKSSPPPRRSNANPLETEACVARLAARGLLVPKGEKDKPVAPKPVDEPFYPFSSIAASDPFSANPVSEELYATFAARGLSLSLASRRNEDGAGPSRRAGDHGSEEDDGARGSDQPGDVIIYDRTAGGTSGQGGAALRAMLEARGLLRVEGGRATLRIQGFQEEEEREDGEDSDYDGEEEESEVDTEDDEEAEEWYRNYIRQRELEAQEGRESNEASDESMSSAIPEDEAPDRITEQLDVIVSQGDESVISNEVLNKEADSNQDAEGSISKVLTEDVLKELIDDVMDSQELANNGI